MKKNLNVLHRKGNGKSCRHKWLLLVIVILGLPGCGQRLMAYRSLVLQGAPPRHEIVVEEVGGAPLEEPEGAPIADAKVTFVVDTKEHHACSLPDSPGKYQYAIHEQLLTNSRGEVVDVRTVIGGIFRTNYLNVCVEADGFAPYEYVINLEQEHLGGPNVRKTQIIYLAPLRGNHADKN